MNTELLKYLLALTEREVEKCSARGEDLMTALERAENQKALYLALDASAVLAAELRKG
jgi:hypothetical protein